MCATTEEKDAKGAEKNTHEYLAVIPITLTRIDQSFKGEEHLTFSQSSFFCPVEGLKEIIKNALLIGNNIN